MPHKLVYRACFSAAVSLFEHAATLSLPEKLPKGWKGVDVFVDALSGTYYMSTALSLANKLPKVKLNGKLFHAVMFHFPSEEHVSPNTPQTVDR